MSGRSWDNGIGDDSEGGFKIKLKFSNKIPNSIYYDLNEIEIKDGKVGVINIIHNKVYFPIDKKDISGNNNWIEVKLKRDSGTKRYILNIYDSKNPESKVEFKFTKEWRG